MWSACCGPCSGGGVVLLREGRAPRAPEAAVRPARYRSGAGVVCEGLGEGPVSDKQPGLDVPVKGFRREVGGGHEHLLVVLDDGLGMKDRPGRVTWVDGPWAVVDVIYPG